jgi:hypothetical protein
MESITCYCCDASHAKFWKLQFDQVGGNWNCIEWEPTSQRRISEAKMKEFGENREQEPKISSGGIEGRISRELTENQFKGERKRNVSRFRERRTVDREDKLSKVEIVCGIAFEGQCEMDVISLKMMISKLPR